MTERPELVGPDGCCVDCGRDLQNGHWDNCQDRDLNEQERIDHAGKLERYQPDFEGAMNPNPQGGWVRYEDVAKLEATNTRMRIALEDIKRNTDSRSDVHWAASNGLKET